MAASNVVVRPVILSRPANTARPLSMCGVGASTTVSSSGGAAAVGSGGEFPAGGALAPRCAGAAEGATAAPGGGGNGCASTGLATAGYGGWLGYAGAPWLG